MKNKFARKQREDISGTSIASNLETPALLVHDEADEVTPLSDSTALAEVWQNAELLTTSGLSHRGVLRDNAVVRQVVDFIQR